MQRLFNNYLLVHSVPCAITLLAGFEELLIQTTKRRLINVHYRGSSKIRSISDLYQSAALTLQTKNLNLSLFEAHFGRKTNARLNNLKRVPVLKNLFYMPTLFKNLDLSHMG